MSTPDWRSLAAKRHSPSMLAGAAAVLAVPYLYADPGMIHYGAAAVLGSGLVASLIECVRWLWHQITS